MKKFCMAIAKERPSVPNGEAIVKREIVDGIHDLLENVKGIEVVNVVRAIELENVYSIHLRVEDDKVDMLKELYSKITIGVPFQEPFEEDR